VHLAFIRPAKPNENAVSVWYIEFFNARRPRSALDRRTPDAVYFDSLPFAVAA